MSEMKRCARKARAANRASHEADVPSDGLRDVAGMPVQNLPGHAEGKARGGMNRNVRWQGQRELIDYDVHHRRAVGVRQSALQRVTHVARLLDPDSLGAHRLGDSREVRVFRSVPNGMSPASSSSMLTKSSIELFRMT